MDKIDPKCWANLNRDDRWEHLNRIKDVSDLIELCPDIEHKESLRRFLDGVSDEDRDHKFFTLVDSESGEFYRDLIDRGIEIQMQPLIDLLTD